MPNTVDAPASTIKIHKFNCISGQWYRRRCSRITISVPDMLVEPPDVGFEFHVVSVLLYLPTLRKVDRIYK